MLPPCTNSTSFPSNLRPAHRRGHFRHVRQSNVLSLPAVARKDYLSIFRRREEDEWAKSGAYHPYSARSQARVHAHLVRRLPALLVYAIVLYGHARHVLRDP